jgi:hypothetical protein
MFGAYLFTSCLLWKTENDSGQQRGRLRPNIDRNRRRRGGLDWCWCGDAATLRPSLHPVRHAATEKQCQPQPFGVVGRNASGIAAELLVMLDQILPANRLAEGFAQRSFF